MSNSTNMVTKVLFVLTCALLLSAVAGNFYAFYVKQDYDFTVETPCEEGELCFIRSCEGEECPPNELERYRMFTLNASDFEKCQDSSCLNSCTSGVIKCEEVSCDESAGDTCSIVSTSE